MAKKPNNPRLLPPIDYNPQRDDDKQRGGGDYEYYSRANTYNANPEYAQQFGGSGGGYEPPPVLPPVTPPPPSQFGPLASGYVQAPQFLQTRTAGALGALQNQQEQINDWYPQGQPDNPGMGGTVNNQPIPQWGPLNTGYKQSPQFLQGRAPGETGAMPNQQAQINQWYPQGQGDPKGMNGVGNPSIPGWQQGIYDWLNQTGDAIAGGLSAGVGQPNIPQSPTGSKVQYNPLGSATTGANNPLGAGGNNPNEPGPMANQYGTDVARTQDAVNKNQRLTQQATEAGDTKELSRLQAEWDRIAPKAAKYGITAERLINSYMQPGNSAAEPTLDRAMGRAIADDTWAGAATVAFGRPPNQLEWDEHWRAMNKGGRDPLEGHPAAIQQIQARMQQIQQENQDEAYGQYQQWLNSQ
jgi:hypothetical protein